MRPMLPYARFTLPGLVAFSPDPLAASVGDNLARVAGIPFAIAMRMQDAAIVLELFQIDARDLDALPAEPRRLEGVERVLDLAYLDAFAGARRLMRSLAELENNDAVNACVDEFDAAFPDLVDLRHSIEHEDDRLRWRERKKRIPMRPRRPGGPDTEDDAGIWYLHRRGADIAATCADGRLGRLEVSEATLTLACAIVQRLFDATGADRPGRVGFPLDIAAMLKQAQSEQPQPSE